MKQIYDVELNFTGGANKDIVKNWRARLERMFFKASDNWSSFFDYAYILFLLIICEIGYNRNSV
ncbi:hypothetical protein psyc5s11_33370 [Clostridium gelidum]|uniref:Uncharacterized protein n=1 Tax=Clostridium gelidum TaxID=704125 RepID=A0ABM7T5L9_9CLOT|nr:hypothetical protein [Clostridium gelidum]BCZ47270.1 hypothetical protein psyc5s11_33370 [Clostridium gelidum]